ncbi:MAG: fumarylacetoacetate hydrolase family protein [Planctomycetota bacterium]
MKFCVVELAGETGASLAVEKDGGLLPLDAPPSVRDALEKFGDAGLMSLARKASGKIHGMDRVLRWFPPVPNPRTFRDFYAFEQHVKAARARRGMEMVPEWYDLQIFYFSNTGSLKGHLEPVKKPKGTAELDFEFEIGCVMGRNVLDVSGEAAEEAIFGFLVLNDWSARDLQRAEMKCSLGPAKGKDFATSIGPWVVTPDELADRRVGPGRYDLAMTGRRNGKPISRANWKDLYHDFSKMIERGSRDATMYAGDLLGSGTCGTGCILELGPEAAGGWLKQGDAVELEIERLGTLTTPIVE